MSLRLLPAITLALALSAAPATAATLEPLKRCYVSTGPSTEQLEDIVISGEDFTAMSAVEALIDGIVVGNAPTGSVGEFELKVDAPHQPRGERAFTLVVRDAVNVVTTESRVTNLAMIMRPKRASPSHRVRFRGRGFTGTGPLYAHYLFGGQEQKTVRLARRVTAPCGRFSVKRRQIPVPAARPGRWIMQVDQKREYSPEPDPVWVRLPIRVEEVFVAP